MELRFPVADEGRSVGSPELRKDGEESGRMVLYCEFRVGFILFILCFYELNILSLHRY